MNWKPSKSDLEWTRRLIATGKKGWAGTFGLLVMNHEKKTYRWSFQLEEPITCQRIDIVMKQLGWTIEKASSAISQCVGHPFSTEFYYKEDKASIDRRSPSHEP
jgi:hypothetical protein